MSDFRAETVNLTAMDRIKLRRLFQKAGFHCNSGEESAKAPEFLAKLADAADRTGGEPPLPPKPSRAHIEDLRTLTGNEQLSGILNQYDTLEQDYDSWIALANLATERRSGWENVQTLLKHALATESAGEIAQQIQAIKDERRLLEERDPLQDIRRELQNTLRMALTKAVELYNTTYDEQLSHLGKTEVWQRLDSTQREKILANEGLYEATELTLGDGDALLKNLGETSILGWKTRTNALPQQFTNAALSAAKLLEPKTHNLKLTSGTLRTPDDVREWLQDTERKLLEQIKQGPVIIS
jgi:hypothetical protein